MSTAETPKISALASWFGSNRTLAPHVGRALAGCEWVGVPFMGGGSELAHLDARTIVANDLHRHVVNLARALADAEQGPRLIRELRRLPFHPDVLAKAQGMAPYWADMMALDGPDAPPNRFAAHDYFVCCWMGRSGVAGTDGEFRGGLPVRWDAGGGGSAVRYRSAVESLRDWRKVLARCEFTCMDAFAFLAKCKDRDGHGLYVDAPWPDDGDGYAHKFGEAQQARLATELAGFSAARVVVRFGDHPTIRRLYPEPGWRWVEFAGRTSANKAKAEVLLLRNAPDPAPEAP